MPPQRCDDIILIDRDIEQIIVRVENQRISQANAELTDPIDDNSNTIVTFGLNGSHWKIWLNITGFILAGVFIFTMKQMYGNRGDFNVMQY